MFRVCLQLSSGILFIQEDLSETSSEMYIGFHVKYPLFLSDFNEPEFSQQNFETYSNKNFHENSSSGSPIVPRGQTDMMKLIVVFRSFAKSPKKRLII